MTKPEMHRSGKELTYSLEIEAPRNMVWQLRTDTKLMPKYYKTHNISAAKVNVDMKKGGKIELVLKDEDGTEHTSTGKFTEVKPNESSNYELETHVLPGKKFNVRENFEDLGQRTRYNMKITFDQEEDMYRMMDVGWHLLISEYMTTFGKIVDEVIETGKTPPEGPFV